MSRSRLVIAGIVATVAVALACSRQSPVPTSPSGQADAGGAVEADGATLKAEPPVLVSPINDQQAKDSPTLTAKPTAMTFDGSTANLQYRFEVYDDRNVKILDSGLLDAPSYRITRNLTSGMRHTWRVRAELRGRVSRWSDTGSFVGFRDGYIRGDEVYDPLSNGITVGERIGPTTFVEDQGIRLDSTLSYVRYLIPTTITSGEFSMEILGLRANAPGEKSKVFGMSTDSEDFITDPNRFDVQYRGASGEPPNSITFRALYGSADDPGLLYEPDAGTRARSVYLLDPETVYFWKATWGAEVRVVLKEGGANGRTLYDVAIPTPRGTYNPVPHYAYLGTPTGRSGPESASIPGTIFRNVWISARPRPAL